MQAVAREVTHRYVDPVAQIWLAAARRIGLGVVRRRLRGRRRRHLAIRGATLDADDSLDRCLRAVSLAGRGRSRVRAARLGDGQHRPHDHGWREAARPRLRAPVNLSPGLQPRRRGTAPATGSARPRISSRRVLADRRGPSVRATPASSRSPSAVGPGAPRGALGEPRRTPQISAGFRDARRSGDRRRAPERASLWLGGRTAGAASDRAPRPRRAAPGPRPRAAVWRSNARCRRPTPDRSGVAGLQAGAALDASLRRVPPRGVSLGGARSGQGAAGMLVDAAATPDRAPATAAPLAAARSARRHATAARSGPGPAATSRSARRTA
jgi:hypothetical protein